MQTIPAKTIQKFYEGKANANILLNLSATEKKRHTNLEFSITDIAYNWSDYELQTNKEYIEWIAPEINKHLYHQFTLKNSVMKTNLINIVLRFIELIGYRMNSKGELEAYVPVIRKEKDIVVGLTNPNIYKNITKLFMLLDKLKFTYLSCMLFLAITKAMSESDNLRTTVISHPDIIKWISFQRYLNQEETQGILGIELNDWEQQFDLEVENDTDVNVNSNDAW